MSAVSRLLPATPWSSLGDYIADGGGQGLAAARIATTDDIIEMLDRSGLRGRGGAGFPTGRKWRTVTANRASVAPTPVVVNAAEGEPGTFKDRQLLRSNPYLVLEGALIAAVAMGGREVVIAIKASFDREKQRLAEAIESAQGAGWTEGITVRVVDGPSSYLFGEETALLEVIEGRPAFPRVSPPYRRGLQPDHPPTGHSAAGLDLASALGADGAPALVDNVETLANVALVIRHGPDWFRSVGTTNSTGTIICTVTGATTRQGVGEFAMGTSLRAVIEALGVGPREGRTIIGVLPGVSNPVLFGDALDTPLTYEDMAAAGSGLGSAGFIVLDDATDLRQVAADVSRFLAIESCGQCEPCKRDGLAVAAELADEAALRSDFVRQRLETVARGARCALAGQQERVVGSLLPLLISGGGSDAPADRDGPVERLILPLVDIVEGEAVLDTSHLEKQPDWSYNEHDSGKWPAQRLADHLVNITSTRVPEAAEATPGKSEAVRFDALGESHRLIEAEVDRFRRCAPEDREQIATGLHRLLSVHLDIGERLLHPEMSRMNPDSGDDIIWYPEAHKREALRLLDRIEAADQESATPRLIDELASDIHRYVIEVELRILPLIKAHLIPAEQVKLERAIEAALLTTPADGRR